MGVRVLSGDQTGYAYVENISLDEMLTAARTAARIANGAAGKGPAKLTEEPIINNYYGVQTPLGRDCRQPENALPAKN